MLAENLRRIMAQRTWSQVRLANESGVSSQNISRILSGKVLNPGPQVVSSIADALGVTIDELVTGKRGSGANGRKVPLALKSGGANTLRIPIMRSINSPRPHGGIMEADIVSHLDLPAGLVSDSTVYGIRVEDGSAEPEARCGSIVVINHRPTTISECNGKLCLVHTSQTGNILRVVHQIEGKPEIYLKAGPAWESTHGPLMLKQSQVDVLGVAVGVWRAL